MARIYLLWSEQHLEFAKDWILRNAQAAVGAIQPDTDAYGRFFDGPAPITTVTAFQTNGGDALAFSAAAIDPAGVPAPQSWKDAAVHDQEIASEALPASMYTFESIW